MLIPIRELQPGEVFNYDHLGSSGFLVLITKGLPTVAASYTKLIGYYQGSVDIDVGARNE